MGEAKITVSDAMRYAKTGKKQWVQTTKNGKPAGEIEMSFAWKRKE